jgi:hypothetical protein
MPRCRLLICSAAIAACAAAPAATPGPAPGAAASLSFIDRAAEYGMADEGVNSTGPTFVDFDNDGDVDLYVATEAHQKGHENRLYRNDGGGRFTSVGPEVGVALATMLSRGASWGDIDNDGDEDLIQATMPSTGRGQFIPATLFRNQLKESGVARFENVTRAARLMRTGNAGDEQAGGVGNTAGGPAWADYDNDGDLDLYMKNADYEIDNVLFRNNGNGTFTDVTAESGAGIQDKIRETNSQGAPSWTDFDQDGWIDLLVTNEGDSKAALRNNADGTFTDITKSRQPPSAVPFLNPGNANGACVGDIDNDGDFDVFLPTADQANRLVVSQLAEEKVLKYRDITLTSGVADRGGARGCAMADFDNDGLIDIYVNNGGPSNVLINDVITQMPPSVQFYIAFEPAENRLYRNNGNLTFTDVTAGSGAEGMGVGSGVGAADVNDDGFPDLFVANRTYYSMGQRVSPPDRNHLFVNRGNSNHWLRIRLQGTKANRSAWGARVKVVSGDLAQYREHTSAHGYNSGNDPRLLLGLGARRKVDLIEVRWPGGGVQTLRDVKADQTVTIVQK